MNTKKWWQNIFADPSEGLFEEDELSEKDKKELMKKIADQVVKRQLTVPTIMFLESIKPLSFIGSQAMIFFNPIAQIVYPTEIYGRLQMMFEDRANVELLIQTIEKEDANFSKKLKEERDKEKNSDKRNQNKIFGWWKRRSDEAKETDEQVIAAHAPAGAPGVAVIV